MNRILVFLAIAIIILFLTGCQTTESIGMNNKSGKKLILVKDGVSSAPIILYKGAPRFTEAAVVELAQYIEKTSGVKPEIIKGEPEDTPEHAIWVGYQPALKNLFPKIDLNFKYPEEIIIAANSNHLVIAGHDRWDSERMTILGNAKKPIKGVQQEYGTANAVYTFLQKYLWCPLVLAG